MENPKQAIRCLLVDDIAAAGVCDPGIATAVDGDAARGEQAAGAVASGGKGLGRTGCLHDREASLVRHPGIAAGVDCDAVGAREFGTSVVHGEREIVGLGGEHGNKWRRRAARLQSAVRFALPGFFAIASPAPMVSDAPVALRSVMQPLDEAPAVLTHAARISASVFKRVVAESSLRVEWGMRRGRNLPEDSPS